MKFIKYFSMIFIGVIFTISAFSFNSNSVNRPAIQPYTKTIKLEKLKPPAKRKFSLRTQTYFLENKGQLRDKTILFYSYVRGGIAYFKKDAFGYIFSKDNKTFKCEITIKGKIEPLEKCRTFFNFYYPEVKAEKVRSFKKLMVKNKDYSIIFYKKNGNLEYDIHTENLKKVKLKYNTFGGKLSKEKDKLVIQWGDTKIKEFIPQSYLFNGKATKVKYSVKNNIVSFKGNSKVIVDPATYIGGDQDEIIYKMVKDGNDFWFTGSTFSSNFPNLDSYGNTGNGDIVLGCFENSPTNSLKFLTIIGGSNTDEGFSLKIFKNTVFVCGYTTSSDFPQISRNPYQPNLAYGEDGIIVRFNKNDGTPEAQTYLGGSNNERLFDIDITIFRNGVMASYAIIVTGPTWSSDMQTSGTAFQTSYAGYCDGYVAVLPLDLSSLRNATYLGGNSIDYPYQIFVAPLPFDPVRENFIFIYGTTASTNFPTKDPYQPNNAGGYDTFFTVLYEDLSDLKYSTYIGGTNQDYGYFMTFTNDTSSYLHICLTGETFSSNYPLNHPYQNTYAGNGDGFVTIMMIDNYNHIFQFFYSTYFGGNGEDKFIPYFLPVKLSNVQKLILMGNTKSTDLPFESCFYTEGYSYNNTFNLYAAAFDYNTNSGDLTFLNASIVGGNADEWAGSGVAWFQHDNILNQNIVYVAIPGWTESTDFPGTEGQFQEEKKAQKDMIITSFPLRKNIADISVTKTSDKTEYYPGEEVIYTITVNNSGTEPACDVVLNDNMPAEIENPEYSIDNGNSWQSFSNPINIGDIEGGESRTILIKGIIGENISTDTVISNSVSVNTGAIDPDLNNNTASTSFQVTCANYSIDTTVDNGTTPDPHIIVCNPDDCVTVHFYPDDGYVLGELIINGRPHCFCPNQTTYTFCDIDGDQTIHVVFIKEEAPVITSFTVTPECGIYPLTVKFNCDAYDPDGGIVTDFQWDFNGDGVIDKKTGDVSEAETVYPNPGVYYARVYVHDTEGHTTVSAPLKIKVGINNPVCYSPKTLLTIQNKDNADNYLKIINDNCSEANLKISYFNSENNIIEERELTLVSGGGLSFSSPWCQSENIVTIKIESDMELTYLLGMESDKTRGLSLFAHSPDNTVFIPHIAEEQNIWLNNVIISNPLEREVNLNNIVFTENLFDVFNINNKKDKIELDPTSWIKIDSKVETPFSPNSALSGAICYSLNNGDISLVSSSKPIKHGFINHIPTETESFWYGYVLTNIDNKEGDITLTFFSEEGENLGTKNIHLESGQKIKGLLSNDFPEFNGQVAWIKLDSDINFVGESVYGAISNNEKKGICGLAISGKSGTDMVLPLPYTDENDWIGLSIINVSEEPNNVIIKLIDDMGNVIEQKSLTINPLSQFKGVLKNIFTNTEHGFYIKVESEKPITGCLITGNQDNSIMAGYTGKVY